LNITGPGQNFDDRRRNTSRLSLKLAAHNFFWVLVVLPGVIGVEGGSVFIVNGEDNREMFSVPTCQYGKSHPISLVIDGDNKTIHLIRHAKDQASPVTKDSVYSALIKPDTNNKEKKGDTSSIDRVISAVLSRWKIVESS